MSPSRTTPPYQTVVWIESPTPPGTAMRTVAESREYGAMRPFTATLSTARSSRSSTTVSVPGANRRSILARAAIRAPVSGSTIVRS